MKVEIDGQLYVPAPPAVKGEGHAAALEVRFDSDAGDQLTIREYLRELLVTLWREQEGFSGKRPFGNSDWPHEPISALIKAGFIKGEYNNEDEWCEAADLDAAMAYVRELILVAFSK